MPLLSQVPLLLGRPSLPSRPHTFHRHHWVFPCGSSVSFQSHSQPVSPYQDSLASTLVNSLVHLSTLNTGRFFTMAGNIILVSGDLQKGFSGSPDGSFGCSWSYGQNGMRDPHISCLLAPTRLPKAVCRGLGSEQRCRTGRKAIPDTQASLQREGDAWGHASSTLRSSCPRPRGAEFPACLLGSWMNPLPPFCVLRQFQAFPSP